MMFSCLFNVVLICVGKVTKNIQIMAHFGQKKDRQHLLVLSVFVSRVYESILRA